MFRIFTYLEIQTLLQNEKKTTTHSIQMNLLLLPKWRSNWMTSNVYAAHINIKSWLVFNARSSYAHMLLRAQTPDSKCASTHAISHDDTIYVLCSACKWRTLASFTTPPGSCLGATGGGPPVCMERELSDRTCVSSTVKGEILITTSASARPTKMYDLYDTYFTRGEMWIL